MSNEKKQSADEVKGFQAELNREEQLQNQLDDFIATEKRTLSGQDDAGDDVELQYRLDDFMHKLHDRMDDFMNDRTEASSGPSSSDDMEVPPESGTAISEAASGAVSERETEPELEAATAESSAEHEIEVYNIGELNAADLEQKRSSRVIQLLIVIAIAVVVGWAVWPVGKGLQTPVKPVVEIQASSHPVENTQTDKQMETLSVTPEDNKASSQTVVSGKKLTVMLAVGNVRSGPSGGADILFRLKRGDVVTELSAKWGWHQIRLDDGKEGWAYQSLFVEPKPAKPEVSTKADPEIVKEPEAATEAEVKSEPQKTADTEAVAAPTTETAPSINDGLIVNEPVQEMGESTVETAEESSEVVE